MLSVILQNCKSLNNIEALKTMYFALVRSKLGVWIIDMGSNLRKVTAGAKVFKVYVFKT